MLRSYLFRLPKYSKTTGLIFSSNSRAPSIFKIKKSSFGDHAGHKTRSIDDQYGGFVPPEVPKFNSRFATFVGIILWTSMFYKYEQDYWKILNLYLPWEVPGREYYDGTPDDMFEYWGIGTGPEKEETYND